MKLPSLLQVSFCITSSKRAQTTISRMVPVRFVLVSGPHLKLYQEIVCYRPKPSIAGLKLKEKELCDSANDVSNLVQCPGILFCHVRIIQLAIASTYFSGTCWIF